MSSSCVRSAPMLKFTQLRDLTSWSVSYLLGAVFLYNQDFPLVALGEVLSRNREQIEIKNECKYTQLTVKIHNRGVVKRGTRVGKEIGTKNQYVVRAGQFIFSRIDARHGAFGLIPAHLDGSIVTNDFPTFDVSPQKAIPQFLVLITTTDPFIHFVKSCSQGTTNRQRVNVDMLLQQKIPLPPLTIQQQLVDAYYSLMQEAEGKEREAEALQSAIDDYILQKLGIDSDLKKSMQKGLNIVNFTELSIWGAEQLLHDGGFNFLKSDRFPNYPLTVLLHVNPRTDLEEDCSVSFVPMAAVSDEYGEIVEHRSKSTSESRGYTKFQEGDLIWARITPCMENGKSAVARNLRNGLGFGSTEFHVLRPKVPELSIDFIHALLRLKLLREQGTYHFTGSAGQQRVPKQFLEELLIPLPPLSTQQEIVTEVHRMQERIKALRQAAGEARERALADFEQAIFV